MAPKKTTAAKKAPVKKIAVKAAPKKPVAKKAPVKKVEKIVIAQPMTSKQVEPSCTIGSGCGCGCRCGFGRFIKKLLIFFVIFSLGFTTCHYLCSRGHRIDMHKKGMGMNRPDIFTDGCLDMNKIKNAEFAEHIVKITANADADKNGCVSVEEFKNADRPNDRPMGGQMERDGKGPMRK